jgi:hypothetical protein
MFTRDTRVLLLLPVLASAAVIGSGCQTQASLEIRYQQGPRPEASTAPNSARAPVVRPSGIVFRPAGGKLEMLVMTRR